MLFRQAFLDGIRSGTITLAFRRWRRPSVRPGGTLLTPIGEVHIGAVTPVEFNQITEADAHRAGYKSLEAALAELNLRPEGEVYRIELGPTRPDPRISLRETPATNQVEFREILRRLDRLDARGPWTIRVLNIIRTHTGIRAGDLCELAGQEKQQFKLNVRKLKSLGLTESLGTGYRLSPRGAALLDTLGSTGGK